MPSASDNACATDVAGDGCSRLSEAFLDQFAAVKLFQLRLPAYRMDGRFTPEESQQRIALFCQSTEALSPPTGIFARDDPYVAGQFLGAGGDQK